MVRQIANTIRVYDPEGKKLAYLQNAYEISYELILNQLWYAGFTLPADDPKNIYCQPFNLVEIYDNDRRIELFRILPAELTRNTRGDIRYECEHVLATLLDNVLFLYHQIGNLGVYTPQVLRYILDRQSKPRWQLSACEFQRQFEYKWENENLLAALFSVPKCFNEEYRWEYDTTARPWQLSLKRPPKQRKAEIRYKKNLTEIVRHKDPTNIVTRLYCLGYGEGDNQLTISAVNNGLPYLEAPTVSTWGLKESVLVDRRFENAESLKAYGQAMLDRLKDPYLSYTVKAVDLHRIAPEKYAEFWPGDIVHVADDLDGIMLDAPIVKVAKHDLTGDPGAIEVVIANQSRNIAGTISELQNRTRINELYAQGATNQMMVNFADNADASHPAILDLYIPDTMVRINKCVLHYELAPFRGYSKAVSSAPATSSGASSRNSSGSSSSRTTGPSSSRTTDSSSETTTTTSSTWNQYAINVPNAVSSMKNHDHGIASGTRLAILGPDGIVSGSVGWVPSGGHQHSLISDHRHGMRHDHGMQHTHDNDHTHQIEHTHQIASHGHTMEFGIYEGSTASRVTIRVDGKNVPILDEEIDIVKYLSVDDGGKIRRNIWHRIEIIPDRMSRIIANVFMQIFTNSRGGGDY